MDTGEDADALDFGEAGDVYNDGFALTLDFPSRVAISDVQEILEEFKRLINFAAYLGSSGDVARRHSNADNAFLVERVRYGSPFVVEFSVVTIGLAHGLFTLAKAPATTQPGVV